jgi:hypothetical protein
LDTDLIQDPLREVHMPRIVPTRVVAFIDKVLPQRGGMPTLGRGNAGQLRALITLVDGIPDELLTIDSDSYAELACGGTYQRDAGNLGRRSKRKRKLRPRSWLWH